MKLIPETAGDDYVELSNGMKARIVCVWHDIPNRIVSSFSVRLVEGEDQQVLSPIAKFEGLMTQEEANEKGTKLANDWCERNLK
ncbi:hypothetical protein IB234_15105 [Pseudomonas sp. PDM16]|uniref:hypothetical protein n=1 Tax=Pseudomonas sp. PDM16 TaxID=2769292 RepID=UPI001780CA6A|nr:hypothetical protein [Pseudomonas sp. PDM16]MBD9415889.1 hypothetical protein [Pseudomonas sp. PDM16]